MSLFEALHPDVTRWCEEHFVAPTPPQRDALAHGTARKNLLISSPTGTGKTLAAFLPIISRLAYARDRDELFARTYALYVSPLRALGYDVEHNLRRPMREMHLLERPNTERAKRRRGRIRETFVRTGVRTSDTPQQERRLMLSRPPHILVTTPESLAVMLAMESYRRTLRLVETVVIDEVHALAGNKRGAQLSLLLESLETLVEQPFNRVGLSATVAPLDRVAHFVAGTDRSCEIVDHRGLRSIHIDIVAPFGGAMAPLETVAKTAVKLSSDVRTSLVFTNVRSQAERIAHAMSEATGGEGAVEDVDTDTPRRDYDLSKIGVHHSALERSVRHRVEAALRAGKLQTVVCSSSLELGVDIGFIDRVLIVGGARGMTSTLQRIGRAGHRPDAIARGTIVAQDRDDIIEAAATKRCIADGVIDDVTIPQAPLDVLAQWMVGSVCYDKRLTIDDVIAIARRAYPFASLERNDVVRCAQYLSGGAGGDDSHVRRLGFDGEAIFGLGRDVCAAFFENVGTIPDEQHVIVRVNGVDIGRVEESFVNDLNAGDVFVLNGRTLRVKELTATAVSAEPFAGRPTVPQWSSHLKGIPLALAREITHLRVGVAEYLRRRDAAGALRFLHARYALTGPEASHVVRYIAQQRAISAVPDQGRPVVEIYRMDTRQTAVFHTCAGRRVNETLARVVGARVFRIAKANTQITTDDNGFLITLPPGKALPDVTWAKILHLEHFDRDLLEGLRSSHLLRNYFRYVANTGLLVLRRAGGRRVRRGAQSWNSQKIFERLFRSDRSFPLVRETFRVITRDLLDVPAAREYLQSIVEEPRVLHPVAASPFTFGIITSSFGDSVILDDRASMVEALHERVLQVLGERASGNGDQVEAPMLALTWGT